VRVAPTVDSTYYYLILSDRLLSDAFFLSLSISRSRLASCAEPPSLTHLTVMKLSLCATFARTSAATVGGGCVVFVYGCAGTVVGSVHLLMGWLPVKEVLALPKTAYLSSIMRCLYEPFRVCLSVCLSVCKCSCLGRQEHERRRLWSLGVEKGWY
jgi:hypothetical protein